MSETSSVERLSDEIARGLERWIIQQGLQVGAKLPTEKALCERFGVSRAVIREAIARLKADGCIRTRQGSGAYLSALPGEASFRLVRDSSSLEVSDNRELREVLELRLIMEAGAAELAAIRRTPEDLVRMQSALSAMDVALSERVEAVADDDAFHVAIAMATQNPQLERFQVFMGRQLTESRRPTWGCAGHQLGLARQAQLEHQAVFDAIVRQDPVAARKAAQGHIQGAIKRFGLEVNGVGVREAGGTFMIKGDRHHGR